MGSIYIVGCIIDIMEVINEVKDLEDRKKRYERELENPSLRNNFLIKSKISMFEEQIEKLKSSDEYKLEIEIELKKKEKIKLTEKEKKARKEFNTEQKQWIENHQKRPYHHWTKEETNLVLDRIESGRCYDEMKFLAREMADDISPGAIQWTIDNAEAIRKGSEKTSNKIKEDSFARRIRDTLIERGEIDG